MAAARNAATTEQLVAEVPVGTGPQALAYDNATAQVYVANYGSSNVSVLKGLHLQGTIAVGSGPANPVVDSANGLVYVPNVASNNVSILSGLQSVGSVPVGRMPEAVGWNATTGTAYVADTGGTNVTVLSGSTFNTTVNVRQSGPCCVAFDPRNGDLYVGDGGTRNLSVLSGTRLIATVTVGLYPDAVLFDPLNGFVYVANYGSWNVSVVNGTTVVGSVNVSTNPYNLLFDPSSGFVDVAGNGPTGSPPTGISVLNGTHLVTFDSLGFGSAFGWSEDLAYDAHNGLVYKANLGGGITVLRGSKILRSFNLPNGPPADLVYDAADADLYVSLSQQATVDVISTNPPTYPVDFYEVGLPGGTTWNVTFAGATVPVSTSAVMFNEVNGSYPFAIGGVPGYAANTTSGVVTVQGSPVLISIAWTPRLYPVTFSETGLPIGTPWNVTFDSQTNRSSTSDVGFSVPNGTSLPFSIGPLPGYQATPASGSLTVAGSRVNQSVSFARPPGPLGARGWVNVTGAHGTTYYCVDHAGTVGVTPASSNVSFSAVAWNGTAPYAFEWSFGDGTESVLGAHALHAYTGNRTWTANLTVTDARGATNLSRFVVEGDSHVGPVPNCPGNGSGSPPPTPFLGLSGSGLLHLIGVAVAILAVVAGVAGVLWSRKRSRV